MIEVNNLCFDYPGLRALDKVSFRMPQGNVTALVGPNGAGKTTLMRCIAALEQPCAGSIHIAGIDVLEQPRACHRIIGYLSDFYGLYQRLTVKQCLYFVARAQGLPDSDCETAIAQVCQWLSLSERLEMRPGELSRGLRQRVAIAQAIIHKPKFVLLDEPASGLDPEARHELAGLILDLQRQGMTLLVSSHILAELESYCSDMLILRQGRIVEQTVLRPRKQQITIRLQLAVAIAELTEKLARIDAIQAVNVENNQTAWLLMPDDKQQQHLVLQTLLAQGLPVCEFSAESPTMQDAYLASIRQSS